MLLVKNICPEVAYPETFERFVTVYLATEAAIRKYFSKWVFLKISQHSQENTFFGVTFLNCC